MQIFLIMTVLAGALVSTGAAAEEAAVRHVYRVEALPGRSFANLSAKNTFSKD
jgi:hypothetical protein